jgi:hypothetical protein
MSSPNKAGFVRLFIFKNRKSGQDWRIALQSLGLEEHLMH